METETISVACRDGPEEIWCIDFNSLQREINERKQEMPIIISAKPQQKFCSISRAGIGIPQPIIEKIGWRQGHDRIEVGYIPNANCVLLSKPTQSLDSFFVAFSNKDFRTGAHISCQAFVRNYLRSAVSLPKKDITPILFPHDKWCMAFILGEFPQQFEDFSEEDGELLKKIYSCNTKANFNREYVI